MTTRWVRKLAAAAKGARNSNETIVLPDPITMPVSAVKARPVVLKRTTVPFDQRSTPSSS